MKKVKIKVVVVDDSTFMRKAIRRMLASDPNIRVIGEAKNGEEAIEQVKYLKPDVVTLDVQMPGMDGLTALKKIMKVAPTPVLMVSSLTTEGGDTTLQALAAGAVDFVGKSTCHTHMDILEIADSLIEKIKVIAGVKVENLIPQGKLEPPVVKESDRPIPDFSPPLLVAIGASTGGPISLERVLRDIPNDFPGAILIVQHMPIGFTRSFAERLDKLCAMSVVESCDDELVVPGRAYIGPSGYHLTLQQALGRLRVKLTKKPVGTAHCPSVDVMMNSVAQKWKGPKLGIVLTSMGNDGTAGVREMKAQGSRIVTQDEQSCVVYGMPKAAYQTGCVDKVVSLERVAGEILKFAQEVAPTLDAAIG